MQAGTEPWLSLNWWLSGRESPAMQETREKWVPLLGWEEPQKKAMAPHSSILPVESYGRRSLAGSSPWACRESDTTEQLHFHFSLSCIGEGNGNPLQCSCQENPRDGGAWWAAVYGVAQSWTRLKRLSSSSQYSCLGNPTDRGAWQLQSTGLQRVRHNWAAKHTDQSKPEFSIHQRVKERTGKLFPKRL